MFNVNHNGRVREKSPSFPRRNIAVNDWVRKDTQVGQVVEMSQKLKGGELWVKWSGYSIPINEQTVNLQLLGYQGEDLAGTSFNEGYCKRLVSEDYAVMAEVYLEHKREPQIWSLEQLTNKQLELRTQNSELRTKDNVSSSSEKTLIPLKNIRRDGGTQPRASINHQTVLEYLEDMKNGDTFPAVTVFYDGEIYWLADGFHRLEAAFGIGLTEIAAVVKQGTRRDAVLYSVGANAKHGLRRSNADKRRAVTTLLEDEEWCQWSDRAIAKKCQVSNVFVSKVRKEIINTNIDTSANKSNLTVNINSGNHINDPSNLTVNVNSGNLDNNADTSRIYINKDGVEAKMRVGNIGKSKQTESPPPADEVIISEEAVDTAKTDEVNNHDDSAVDNEETEDSKPKQSQRQRKGKQRLVNPLSIGDKVKVKENHYFGGQEGIVTQLATPYTVIVAFDNDERDVIKLTDLDLPTELTKPILVNESTSKPVKKEIIIKEGLNYKAGEGCKWYVEVSEENYQKLKAYKQKVAAVTIDGVISRFFDREYNQKPITTDDICLNLSSNLKQFTSERVRFILKAIAQSHYNTLINFVESIT